MTNIKELEDAYHVSLALLFLSIFCSLALKKWGGH